MNISVQNSLNKSVSEKIHTQKVIEKTRIISISAGLFESNPDNTLLLECLKLDCIEFLCMTFPQAVSSITGGKS